MTTVRRNFLVSARVLDGRKLVHKIKEQLQKEVLSIKKMTGDVPALVNVMIGADPGSCAYANAQKKIAEYIGTRYELLQLSSEISQGDLIKYIQRLNEDERVNGIMIHKPLPQRISYRTVANCVDTAKDLEGINVKNIGKMILGETRLIPCTPAAVMEHIRSTGVNLRGKEAVIVGHSEIVGKPLSLLLLEQYATVTICHIATSEAGRLQDHVGRADVLIVAVGKPRLIPGDWIKKNAIVIDVGINQVGQQIVGDVVFESAVKRAAFITPVPGGVGPVTVAMLMKNGVEAYRLQSQKNDRMNV